jgi:hypothetical protein
MRNCVSSIVEICPHIHILPKEDYLSYGILFNLRRLPKLWISPPKFISSQQRKNRYKWNKNINGIDYCKIDSNKYL